MVDRESYCPWCMTIFRANCGCPKVVESMKEEEKKLKYENRRINDKLVNLGYPLNALLTEIKSIILSHAGGTPIALTKLNTLSAMVQKQLEE